MATIESVNEEQLHELLELKERMLNKQAHRRAVEAGDHMALAYHYDALSDIYERLARRGDLEDFVERMLDEVGTWEN